MNPDFGQISRGITDFKPPPSNNYVRDAKTFLESNGIVAKFAFIMLVLIAFVTLLRLGGSILGALFEPSRSPVLIKGMIDSREKRVIEQKPNIDGAIPIMRSVNDDQGMEFTWSVWIYINDISNYKPNEYKHVFHKGNDDVNLDESHPRFGMNQPNNAPGLYIAPNTNDLVVVMNSFDKINDEVVVKGIPIKKWVNVIIRLNKQKQLDVYINGTLTKRHILQDVAKQNYGNVYVAMNGGFDGNTSQLRYFDTAIGINKIRNIVRKGPNMKMDGKSNSAKSKPYYLSTQWHLNEVSA